jgi:cupin fold WbuC family metalloprotein
MYSLKRGYLKDLNSKSLSIFLKKDTKALVDKHLLIELKKIAFETKKNIRINLHNQPNSQFHNMIIFQWKNTYIRPHKHIKKEETCHMIQGSQILYTFKNNRMLKEKNKVDFKTNIIFRIDKNIYYSAKILSKFVIFHESKLGPFLGKRDSIFPKWAPKHDEILKINKFFKNL